MAKLVETLMFDLSGTEVQVEVDGESSLALIFDADELGDDWAEELEIWLETAEDERKDKDLILFGFHPVGDNTQVERLLYFRKSAGGATGPVFGLSVDGTVVPGTLGEWAESCEALNMEAKP